MISANRVFLGDAGCVGYEGVKVIYEADIYGFDITDLNFYKCFLAPIDTPHKDMEIQPSNPSIGILIMPKLKDMQTSSYTLLIMSFNRRWRRRVSLQCYSALANIARRLRREHNRQIVCWMLWRRRHRIRVSQNGRFKDISIRRHSYGMWSCR
jgi:hypothetical protein